MTARLLTFYLCNLIDTVATVHLYLTQDGKEFNPISAWLLQCPPIFVLVKLLVSTGAVAFLWWKRDWKLCTILSWILCVEYLLLALYYVGVYALLL